MDLNVLTCKTVARSIDMLHVLQAQTAYSSARMHAHVHSQMHTLSHKFCSLLEMMDGHTMSCKIEAHQRIYRSSRV